jgi:hypothetical protein
MGRGGSGGDEGSGRMMATLVFVAGFLIVILFLRSSFGNILYGPGNVDSQKRLTAIGFSADDLAIYNIFPTNTISHGPTYNITSDKVVSFFSMGAVSWGNGPETTGGWSNMSYHSSSGVDLHLYIVSANGLLNTVSGEAVVFWCHSGLWDSHLVVLRFDDILAKLKTSNNFQKSTIVIQLDQSYTAFFMFPMGADAKTLLEQHTGYIVSVGQSQTQSLTSAGYGGWNYIAGIITFNIPNGGTGYVWFDVIISTVVDASLLFIAYWAITRLIGALIP